jgi:membrane-associated phospholipid phosphatase
MHWLQSLDTALFYFINGALANPFFDWLMPILSGNGVPWLPAVVVAVPAIFIWGSTRLKICALLMLLVVTLGDPLVIGSLKNAVQRHRPFVTLPDARLFGQVGKGYVAPLPDGSLPPTANHASFPSAHSANWFALATVAFLFYRRSAIFLFPLAAAVAFSRVYNGVHYPSDVLAGGIFGAGFAIAFTVLAQTLWNFVGKRFLPNWHAQLPLLLNPQTTFHSPLATRHSSMDWLHLGYLVILLALIGNWIYLASGVINLSQDEAYQWLWSKHLALSYYSKPPGIALLQWLGTHLFGDTEFGVRFCSPLIGAILSMLVLRFMAREVGAKAAFVLLLITFAVPLLVVGSVLLTIDPPLVLCWMWAVIAGWRAAQADGKTRDWLVVGLALGLGFLCKYTAMLQLVCWIIFFALHKPARIHLKKSGPWLALGIFAICTLPVFIWNAQHGWITVSHVAGDAGLLDKSQISLGDHLLKSLNYFLEFTGAELGLLNPIFFIAALAAFVVAWRRRTEKPLWFFLFCMSAPVFLGHWLYAFHSRVQPNWIAAAVPPMLCLMVAVWSESRFRVKPWLLAGIIIGLIANAFLHDTGLIGKIAGHKLPGDKDPAHRLFGWRETAQLVETERAKFDTNAFIIADHYGTTGLYSFYSAPARAAANARTPLVYCVDADRTLNQFPFWDEYDYRQHRHGENALFVLRLDPYPLENGWLKKWFLGESVKVVDQPPRAVPDRIAAEFESVTNLGVREVKIADGRIFQRVQIFGCYKLK